MLEQLQNIRRLLTEPAPENIRLANAELEMLPQAVSELSKRLLTEGEVTPEMANGIAAIKSEISAIMALSRAASEYFSGLCQLRLAGFGAYERTGGFTSLETRSRTIGQL